VPPQEAFGVGQEGTMKVAVTSMGPDPGSEVDPKFGRARWFVIVDTATGDFSALDNASGVDAESGAGVQAADLVAREGVEYVLTGHCGPKAQKALEAAGIKVVAEVSGTVRSAVETFRDGAVERD
jgi:predicted Fe-Mo cluster-binding NifX family protein